MNCPAILPLLFCVLSVCYSFPQNVGPSSSQLLHTGSATVTLTTPTNGLHLDEREQLTHSKIGITLFAVPVKTISKFEFQLINTVGSNRNIVQQHENSAGHSFDQSTTVLQHVTSHPHC